MPFTLKKITSDVREETRNKINQLTALGIAFMKCGNVMESDDNRQSSS